MLRVLLGMIVVGVVLVGVGGCSSIHPFVNEVGPVHRGDGAEVLIVERSGGLLRASASAGRVLERLPLGEGAGNLCVSPDGRRAVVANYGTYRGDRGRTLTVVDLASFTVEREIDLGEHTRPHGVGFVDEGVVVVTSENEQALVKVDVDRGEIVDVLDLDRRGAHSLVVDARRGRVYVANAISATVQVVEVEPFAVVGEIEAYRGVEGLAISADGRDLWIGNGDAACVTVVDLETLEQVGVVDTWQRPFRLAATPERVLVCDAMGGRVLVLCARGREVVAEIDMASADYPLDVRSEGAFGARRDNPIPHGICITPDGRFACVANLLARNVAVIDLGTLEVARRIPTGRHPAAVVGAF